MNYTRLSETSVDTEIVGTTTKYSSVLARSVMDLSVLKKVREACTKNLLPEESGRTVITN